MKTNTPLTRNLEGLQIGAAARVADIAKHFPAQLTSEMFEGRFGESYGDELLRNHARLSVEWAVEVIRAAETAASTIPPTGQGIGPDMSGE